MMKRIRAAVRENRKVREALCLAGLLVYSALFVLFVFSESPMLVAKNISDHLMIRGIERSEEIRIIAVTAEDEETTGLGADMLAALCVEKLNEGESPSVIAFEIPENRMGEEAEAVLQGVPDRENLILPVSLSVPENAVIRAPFRTEAPVAERAETWSAETAGTAALAHTVHLPGEDGIVRHMTFDIQLADGTSCPSMAELVCRKYCEKEGTDFSLPEGAENSSTIIKFSEEEKEYDCTASEILSEMVPAESFAGKIVFIGSFDTASDPGVLTAYDHTRRMHSARIDAEITNALLADDTAFSVPVWIQMILLFFFVFCTAIFMLRVKTVVGGISFMLVYELMTQVISMLLFGIGYGILAFPHMANGAITGILFLAVSAFVRGTRNRAELERVLGKYVDDRIAGGILHGKKDSSLITAADQQGQSKKVAVLFADIRSFTEISEKVSGERLVHMLNDYLTMMSSCVERYGGTVDKYIGDCVLAYWGAPEDDEDPVYHACLAASEIQRRAEEACGKMRPILGRDVHIGIGISYGDVIVGNIGSARRMNFTVIGDAVNTASRLQSIAPGGEIYLSEPAAGMLKSNVELEKLPEEVRLKGKEKAVEVYAVRNISVRGGRHVKKEESEVRNAYKRRGLAAVTVNFFLFFFQFVFVLNALRNFGTDFVAYPTVLLAAFSSAVSLCLIPFDLKTIETANGTSSRPGWLNVAMLSAFVANLQIAVTVLVGAADPVLMETDLAGWTGGAVIYLLCPVLSALGFLGLEIHCRYTWKDVLLGELPLILLNLTGYAVMTGTGLDHKMPELFRLFYAYPMPLATMTLEVTFLFAASVLSTRLSVKDMLRLPEELGFASFLKRYRLSGWYQFISRDRSRQSVWILLDLLIAALNLHVTVKAYLSGGIHVYSNPSLIGIVVGLTSLLMAGILAGQFATKENFNRTPFYRYLSFIRNMGCLLDFFSVLLLAVSGEGLAAFFTPRWSADGWIFLACPVVSMLMWISERNEYELLRCELCAVPYVVIPLLSRAAILGRNLEGMYDFEIANYYSPAAITAVIIGELLTAGLLYLANLLAVRAFREAEREERRIMLSVCGSRYGITAGKKTESEFGLHSECYVLTEGDYGIVIGAGSGMERAVEKLSGCTSVDVILGSTDFVTLMGFLMTPDVCPGAKVRILSPFGAERFSVNPFWPVNLIRKNCVMVPVGKPYRLNDMYSVTFTQSDPEGKNFMIRLEGETTVCCTGRYPAPEELVRRWCADADLLIYNAAENWDRGCYIAIDLSIPELLLTGAEETVPDEELLSREQHSRKLFSDAFVAREGTGFPVRRIS